MVSGTAVHSAFAKLLSIVLLSACWPLASPVSCTRKTGIFRLSACNCGDYRPDFGLLARLHLEAHQRIVAIIRNQPVRVWAFDLSHQPGRTDLVQDRRYFLMEKGRSGRC